MYGHVFFFLLPHKSKIFDKSFYICRYRHMGIQRIFVRPVDTEIQKIPEHFYFTRTHRFFCRGDILGHLCQYQLLAGVSAG
jgi:hypothetical protein